MDKANSNSVMNRQLRTILVGSTALKYHGISVENPRDVDLIVFEELAGYTYSIIRRFYEISSKD